MCLAPRIEMYVKLCALHCLSVRLPGFHDLRSCALLVPGHDVAETVVVLVAGDVIRSQVAPLHYPHLTLRQNWQVPRRAVPRSLDVAGPGVKTVDFRGHLPYPILSNLMDTHRMRTGPLAALTVMLTLALLTGSFAFDDARFCAAMQEIAKEGAAYPRVAVAVVCNGKIINFKIRPEVPVNQLPAGWQERMHVLMNQMYCQGPMRAAINNGWTVAFTIMSAGESYYMTAECR